jgi:hypothetical protein
MSTLSLNIPHQAAKVKAYAHAHTHLYLITALGLGLSFGGYFVLRYLGLWTEQDTEVFVRIIADMQNAGSLRSPGSYTHGYAYPVWATTLANFTGLSVTDLLQLYTPLIGNLFLALFGYACFRRLLASERLGLLATSILFLIPELVFTVSRGNHEKLTVSVTLLAVLALSKSFLEWRRTGRWAVFVGWTVVYYLCAFTLATLNIFFGSSLIVALSVMLVFTTLTVAMRRRAGKHLRPFVRRLAYIVSVNWLLVLLVMWYVYPQSSGTNTLLVETATQRLSALLFPQPEGEPESSFAVSDPYAVTGSDWVNPKVYLLLSSFRWVLFAVSFPTWLVLFTFAIRQISELSTERLFTLGLYGAFGFVLALTIPIDFLNLSAGSNLQVRMYTYFALFATPLLAVGLERLSRPPLPLIRSVLPSLFGMLFIVFGGLSLLKATLDPMVSNRWLFYHPAEVQAAHFWGSRHRHSILWLDVEGRLRYAYTTTYPEAYARGFLTGNTFDFGSHQGGDGFAVRSPMLERTAVAWGHRAPGLWLEDRTYDNGEAQIYHRIPRTPFQQ